MFIIKRQQNKTERNSLTRMSIGEAIVQLIQKKQLGEISVADICKRAGVSRMTYYHYYETKEDALKDYLVEMISLYLTNDKSLDKFGSIEHIIYSFEFFAQYSDYIVGLNRVGCYNILIEGLNKFLEDHFMDVFETSIYDMYFYAGALLNTFVKWIENGKKEPVENVAAIIAKYSTT